LNTLFSFIEAVFDKKKNKKGVADFEAIRFGLRFTVLSRLVQRDNGALEA
jgi:hypothetical protein